MSSIKKLKVRPRKQPPPNPCAVQLTALLACWASTGDILGAKPGSAGCAETAKLLHACMRTTPMPRKMHRPTINYHLARLSKVTK